MRSSRPEVDVERNPATASRIGVQERQIERRLEHVHRYLESVEGLSVARVQPIPQNVRGIDVACFQGKQVRFSLDRERALHFDPRSDDQSPLRGAGREGFLEQRGILVANARQLLMEVRRKEEEALVFYLEAAPLLGDPPFAKDEVLFSELERPHDRGPLLEGDVDRVSHRGPRSAHQRSTPPRITATQTKPRTSTIHPRREGAPPGWVAGWPATGEAASGVVGPLYGGGRTVVGSTSVFSGNGAGR